MTKAQERQRRISLIAMYVLGIGIGCVLVGLMLSAKRAMLGTPPSSSTPSSNAAPATVPSTSSGVPAAK